MNDTFTKLYALSGLDQLRVQLARDLLFDTAKHEGEKRGTQAVKVDERRLASVPDSLQAPRTAVRIDFPPDIACEHPTLTICLLCAPIQQDLFECYLAYLDLVHGSKVAEDWFVSLAEPWLQKLDAEGHFLETMKGLNELNDEDYSGLKRHEILAKISSEAGEARRQRSWLDKLIDWWRIGR